MMQARAMTVLRRRTISSPGDDSAGTAFDAVG